MNLCTSSPNYALSLSADQQLSEYTCPLLLNTFTILSSTLQFYSFDKENGTCKVNKNLPFSLCEMTTLCNLSCCGKRYRCGKLFCEKTWICKGDWNHETQALETLICGAPRRLPHGGDDGDRRLCPRDSYEECDADRRKHCRLRRLRHRSLCGKTHGPSRRPDDRRRGRGRRNTSDQCETLQRPHRGRGLPAERLRRPV